MNKTPPTLILLYVLLGYVVVQFTWWGMLIYDLNKEIIDGSSALEADAAQELNGKLFMIIGEGTVFVTLLIVGAYFIRKFILKEQQLAKQERNFLLATTHELNTPIAALKLNIQTLKRRDLNEAQKSSMLESGIENADRLEKLVANILVASKIDAGKISLVQDDVSVLDSIEETLSKHTQVLIESNISVSKSISEGLYLRGDGKAMQLIIDNLIQNAIKYAPNAPLSIAARAVDSSCIIEVSDEGPGADEETISRMFRKFYRSGDEQVRKQKGTGLGLYLVSELVKRQNGSIQAKSNNPHGLRVIIKLPLSK